MPPGQVQHRVRRLPLREAAGIKPLCLPPKVDELSIFANLVQGGDEPLESARLRCGVPPQCLESTVEKERPQLFCQTPQVVGPGCRLRLCPVRVEQRRSKLQRDSSDVRLGVMHLRPWLQVYPHAIKADWRSSDQKLGGGHKHRRSPGRRTTPLSSRGGSLS